MSDRTPEPTARRPTRTTILAALTIVSATLIGVVAGSSTAASRADGVVSDEVTVFADDHPAVANLDPALRGALRKAATDAASQGVEIVVKSGWRSTGYQEQLFDEAVSKYGSKEGAARWVAVADASRHVAGDAVDIGRAGAMAWLSRHGATYGLCRIYRNEPWHFELRSSARVRGCPPLYATPAHDPRMQP